MPVTSGTLPTSSGAPAAIQVASVLYKSLSFSKSLPPVCGTAFVALSKSRLSVGTAVLTRRPGISSTVRR